MKFSYYLWGLYLIVYPFYFFEQGKPQIADIFGVIIVAINLKSIVRSINSNTMTRYLFLFVLYSFIVNTAWMLILGNSFEFDDLMLKHSLYYTYGFLMLLFVFSKIKDDEFLRITFYSIGLSVCLQLLLWPFFTDQSGRTQMFFKNPNQLAFWALSLLLITNMLIKIINPKKLYQIIFIVACTFLAFISASKAAILGCVLFWIYYFINSKRKILVFTIIVIGSSIFLISNKDIKLERISLIDNIIERITEKKPANQQGFEGRGYGRIIRYPKYLFFGAGEGKVERFNEHLELHSTLFNILFSYGIIGLSIFIFALSSIFKNASIEVLVYFMIVIMYTLVHMTLRAPLFWILLLMLYILKEKVKEDHKIILQ